VTQTIAIHTVKSGDTLSVIARDVLGDMSAWPKIAQLNNLVEPYTIFPGMQLILPDMSVLGPVVVPAGRPPVERAPPDPGAGFGFDLSNLTQQQWMYVAAGGLLLMLMLGKK